MDASFYVALSFVLFVAVLVYFRMPQRLLGVLDAKAADIDNRLREAHQLRDKAKEHLAQSKRQEDAARAKADDLLAQAKALADSRIQEMEAEFKSRLDRYLAQSNDRLAQLEQTIQHKAYQRAADMAVGLASQRFAKILSEDDKQAMLTQSLSELERALAKLSS